MAIIRTVTLSGEEYPIAYNMLRMEQFFKSKGMELDAGEEWMKGGSIEALMALFADMLAYGAKRSKVKFDLDIDDVADLVGFDIDVVSNAISEFMPDDESMGKPSAPSKTVTKKKSPR